MEFSWFSDSMRCWLSCTFCLYYIEIPCEIFSWPSHLTFIVIYFMGFLLVFYLIVPIANESIRVHQKPFWLDWEDACVQILRYLWLEIGCFGDHFHRNDVLWNTQFLFLRRHIFFWGLIWDQQTFSFTYNGEILVFSHYIIINCMFCLIHCN